MLRPRINRVEFCFSLARYSGGWGEQPHGQPIPTNTLPSAPPPLDRFAAAWLLLGHPNRTRHVRTVIVSRDFLPVLFFSDRLRNCRSSPPLSVPPPGTKDACSVEPQEPSQPHPFPQSLASRSPEEIKCVVRAVKCKLFLWGTNNSAISLPPLVAFRC